MVTGSSKQIVNWEERDLQFFNKIPYIRGISRKLFNNKYCSFVSSKVATATKIPKACRQNAIFLVDTNKLKAVNDVNSDLNGAFRKCHEVKYNLFDIKERKVVSNEKRELTEHELRIRIHRTENIYGLIRSFVFFEDNKDICGNVDSVTCQVLFTLLKKVL